MSLQVELISRRGCHLCDEMQALLVRLGADLPLSIRVLDVDSDPGLVLYYSHRVPVLRAFGKALAELRWDETQVRQRLAALRQSADGAT